jgi:hypothetical protein
VEPSNTHCHQFLPPTRAEICDRCRGGQQRRPGAAQDIGDRALADGQTEHFGQHADETLEADRLGDMKMDDQRAQSRPERRARFEPFRRRRCDLPAAAGTDAAMAVDAGDGRADGGQLDVIVGMDVGLIGGAERIGAMRADGQRCLDDATGMFGQRAADAGATLTALLLPIGEVCLLALRGGRARVVRGLARGAEPGLQLCNPRHQHADLRSLRLDQADQIILGKSDKRVAIHGYGESSRPLPCQARFWPRCA